MHKEYAPQRRSRAWFVTSLRDFDSDDSLNALGSLAQESAAASFGSTADLQVEAWRAQLQYLRPQVQALLDDAESEEWQLLFEYEIPRRAKRIDVVLLTRRTVFVIEFKIGASEFRRSDIWQVEDYAADLRDFHKESRELPVIPVLICTKAQTKAHKLSGEAESIICIGKDGLAPVIASIESSVKTKAVQIDPGAWDTAPYSPTPSIIEATQRLFAGHSVRELSHAYADNLDSTVNAIRECIRAAKLDRRRALCIVTGVPGAGKTLAGLVGAYEAREHEQEPAAYLSGNGPLVRVLQAALVRDAQEQGASVKSAKRVAQTLIQNVHEFVKEYGIEHRDLAPNERIVIFDEAQRAWHHEKLSKRHPAAIASEPALILDAMARNTDWCVVVALIGSGQEIHDGEAGLQEWGRAIGNSEQDWRVVVSPQAVGNASGVLSDQSFCTEVGLNADIEVLPELHLSVATRSPRARQFSEWVNAVLALDAKKARKLLPSDSGFRLGFTRDLSVARAWLRDASRDEMRAGLVTSSGNIRLRAYGLEVSPEFLNAIPLEHWFLGARSDIRSSHSLEVALTEFKIQGLELDYVGLVWGDDLTIDEEGKWSYRRFRGSKWQMVNSAIDREYLLNKYRVLLTRSREGMIIWVPRGDPHDPTREPTRLDRVADLLQSSGLCCVD